MTSRLKGDRSFEGWVSEDTERDLDGYKESSTIAVKPQIGFKTPLNLIRKPFFSRVKSHGTVTFFLLIGYQ